LVEYRLDTARVSGSSPLAPTTSKVTGFLRVGHWHFTHTNTRTKRRRTRGFWGNWGM